MNLSAPTQIVFIIALILAVLALLARFAVISALGVYTFWFAIAAWAVLTIGCLLKKA